ncbi:hypothetical protein ACHAPO_011226 [Fusarium lateritium]
MPSLNALLTASLAFTSIALGAPAAVLDKHSSIEQVKNPNFIKSGPLALAHAYTKYGVPLPKGLEKAVKAVKSSSSHSVFKRQNGKGSAIPTLSDDGVQWLTPVEVGTPGQTLNLNLDTGSSDLWVYSNKASRGQNEYNPDKSSTSKKLAGATWSIEYLDGDSASGDVYKDKVSVGGLVVASQAVESAQRVSDGLAQRNGCDGILGLDSSILNTVKPSKQKTFFYNAIPTLQSPVFTADLKHHKPGTYNFGYIDSSAYTGKIGYAPRGPPIGKLWAFKSSGYAVGSAALNESPISGVVDTGTSLLLLPKAVTSAYYAQVSGARYISSYDIWIFRCSATLPDFSFAAGDITITIPGSYINYAPVAHDPSTCAGGIQTSDKIGIAIFGGIALKAAFVVFDGGKKQVGWAKKTL